MHAMLIRDGYLPAVIHAIDRQRYYDALRQTRPGVLTGIVIESLNATLDAAIRTLEAWEQEHAGSRKQKAS